jgi:hypothetical protein
LRTFLSNSPIRDVGRSSPLEGVEQHLTQLVRVLRIGLDRGLRNYLAGLLDLDV